MKIFIYCSLATFLIILLTQFTGCGLANSQYFSKNYSEDTEMNCYMGEVMISEEKGVKNNVYRTIFPGSIKWELVYAGKSNNNVKIYYREYVVQNGAWLAKDAFTQELNYDLSEGNIIRYRDIQMKILSANNEKIVFKVITNKTQPSKN
jgi:hypothetical protein